MVVAESFLLPLCAEGLTLIKGQELITYGEQN